MRPPAEPPTERGGWTGPVVEPKDAATVVLGRDREGGGFEVFLVRRHLNSAFMGGAYVFPGGKVDDSDREGSVAAVCTGLTDAEATARLGLEAPRGGLAFWVAAVRECFEEAGVLLARRPAEPDWLDLTAVPDLEARFVEYRRRLNAGTVSLAAVCRDEGLVMDLGSVGYLSHWVTPPNSPKRYDTRFLVAAAPAGQEPLHDEYETVDSLWLTPDQALVRHERGDLPMARPTVATLADVARFATVGELLDYCHREREVVSHRPDWSPSGGVAKLLRRDETDPGAH